jgi:nucleoid-associated protein YgaU
MMARGTAVATAATGLALLAAAPSPATALGTLADPAAAADPLAPLLAAMALCAWVLLAWLLVVAAATAASRLPGHAGSAASRITRRIAPAGVRRLVEVSLGLTVAVGVLGASPASAGTHLPPAPPAAAASLDWPTPKTPAVRPALDWNPAPSATSRPAAAVARVVVQPGDSLWAVAADHLPAGASNTQIAQAWPSWWAANRAAVGTDPDLIHPGLLLTPPAQP